MVFNRELLALSAPQQSFVGVFGGEEKRAWQNSPETQKAKTFEIKADKTEIEAIFDKNGLTTPEQKDNMWKLMEAFSAKESSSNYNALGRIIQTGPYAGDRAYGRYQIMGLNWSEWAKNAGLDPNAPKTPENQDKITANRMSHYFAQSLIDAKQDIHLAVQLTSPKWYGNNAGKKQNNIKLLKH
jgi:hypothetical protein